MNIFYFHKIKTHHKNQICPFLTVGWRPSYPILNWRFKIELLWLFELRTRLFQKKKRYPYCEIDNRAIKARPKNSLRARRINRESPCLIGKENDKGKAEIRGLANLRLTVGRGSLRSISRPFFFSFLVIFLSFSDFEKKFVREILERENYLTRKS